ncbi:hypothetical protein EH165_02060 [Nakamurella antarctica]|uniref:Uncharacterized protein n=1 Tax=Nakamurella antarctica TaxID=1902245 RepID=A0A3G8ZIA0_9ACTN|nr:hypothetical protein [Nakamurella antarctica]AZI57132.1 hypothetical protein EH165_02060 [Nakamurella antarctica]
MPKLYKYVIAPVLLVGLVLAVGWWKAGWFTSTPLEKVALGDCVQITGTGSELAPESVDCASMEATFKVVAKGESISCGEYDSEFSEFGKGASSEKLCLGLNTLQGDCFRVGLTAFERELKVDCKTNLGRNSVIRITKVAANSTDPSFCSETDSVRVLADRNSVFCYRPNE